MDPAQRERVSEAEYLARERDSKVRHEFVNGEMVAMAGGSFNHALIASNLVGALGNRLAKGRCVVLGSDLRVNVAATRFYAYPDVTIVCGTREFHPSETGTLRNPTVIFEVLSPSSELYDRAEKFSQYRKLPSLQEYVLVSQVKRHVEHYQRTDVGSWTLTEVSDEGTLSLPSAGVKLPLSEIYMNVEFSLPSSEDAGL